MKKFLVFLLLYLPLQAYTQGLSLDYAIGYGSYQLDDIKELQHSLINIYGLQETDCFPNYITHSVSLGYNTKQHYFGANFSYLTTGGRLHRADYSGSYSVDMVMNGYRLGAFYRYHFNTGFTPLSVYFQFSPGVLFSRLQIDEKMSIYTDSAQETTNFKGVGMYLEPTLGARYQLSKGVQVYFGGGYEFDFFGTLKVSGNETTLKAHWNGFRFYGGLIFTLPTNKKSQNE